jgi:broad-specificity NMP kinase
MPPRKARASKKKVQEVVEEPAQPEVVEVVAEEVVEEVPEVTEVQSKGKGRADVSEEVVEQSAADEKETEAATSGLTNVKLTPEERLAKIQELRRRMVCSLVQSVAVPH